MCRQALSGSGKDLGSNSYCLTCQSLGQCPVVCVPRPGQEKIAGKSLEPEESPSCWRWQVSTQCGCICLCSAQDLSPTCQNTSGWPRPAAILRWHLPSAGVSGLWGCSRVCNCKAQDKAVGPGVLQNRGAPLPTPERSRTPHHGLRVCPAFSSLGSGARIT